MELLRVLIGPALRRERQAQKRTLKDVADAARVSITHLSEVERGRKEVSSEVLEAICTGLGLNIVDLLETVVLEARFAERPLVLSPLAARDERDAGQAGQRPAAYRTPDAAVVAAPRTAPITASTAAAHVVAEAAAVVRRAATDVRAECPEGCDPVAA